MAQTQGHRRRRKPVPRTPEATRARLIVAAQTLFNTKGFDGTDSNRIARKAGFAPQTFYRHFPDKTAIFLAVTDQWWRAEAETYARALGLPLSGGVNPSARAAAKKVPRAAAKPAPRTAARILLGFHTEWRIFRRALRNLAGSTPAVAMARCAARQAQLTALASLAPVPRGSRPQTHLSALLTVERLCDAAADGELADLGLSQRAILTLIEDSLLVLLRRTQP
ncbi:MAG TPA: helix-turn-helix domain-containing protein [Rhizomicrobium sp.]|nr:helix-turn-helix domain-containing protein [Rhizomicrobium sp.]